MTIKPVISVFATIVAAVLLQAAQPASAQSANPAPTAIPTVQIPPALPPIVLREHYIEAGYVIPPIVCNAFSPCNVGDRYRSAVLRAAAEFPIGQSITGMVKLDARRYGYEHNGTASIPLLACLGGNASCVTPIGGGAAVPVAAFQATDSDVDVRAGVRALEPRLYLGVSYLTRANNYGYPRIHGYGVGLEKLPDVDQILSLYGGAYYYPTVRGSFTNAAVGSSDLVYHVLRYDMGLTLKPSTHSPIFIHIGYLGDRSRNGGNAPVNTQHNGPFAGVGLTF